jgi:hypothetical protein
MSNEIWTSVKGYEGIYEISSYGRLRSLDRIVRHYSGGDKKIKGKLYKGGLTRGYIAYGLSKNGKMETGYAARLVAINFIPNPENKKEVNHINGIKTDNRIENLEWVTGKENMQHAYKNGLWVIPKGEHLKKFRKAALEKCSKIVLDVNTGVFYNSVKELCDLYGYNQCTIGRRLNGTRKNDTNFKYV